MTVMHMSRPSVDTGGSDPADAAATRLSLRFTGSGSEYFRIWLVNLLLILATLTLYYPYARARRLHYFYANTLLDGQPLGFHGRPGLMMRGYLLMLVLVGGVQGLSQLSPVVAGLAPLAFLLVWPALWCASLRFRLGNTSWRGLRLRFSGSVRGAYAALWAGPGLLVAAALVAAVAAEQAFGVDTQSSHPSWVGLLFALAFPLSVLAVAPFVMWRVRRYQHRHLCFAAEAAGFDATLRAFLGLWFKAMLIGLVGGGVAVGVAAALLAAGGAFNGARQGVTAPMLVAFISGMMVWGMAVVAVNSCLIAGMQNLCWNHTRSARVGFDSRLSMGATFRLSLKNGLLTLLTLGLYRPFAAVALARLRLEAVTVCVLGDPAQWSSPQPARADGAAGDAAGDLLGVDLGL